MKKLKINIASSSRFHLLDLARELNNIGHDVKFYSYVPKSKILGFGLAPENFKSLTLLFAPFIIIERFFPKIWFLLGIKYTLLDLYIRFFTRECDVFIGIGYVYSSSFSFLKKKCLTVNEWGSLHNEVQLKILNDNLNKNPQPKYIRRRIISGYEKADYIGLPSLNSKKSFENMNISSKKLFVNMYGVDTSVFKPTKLSGEKFDILFVGTWSNTKGCDILTNYLKKRKFKFLHVGSIGDLNFPDYSNMVHVDSVEQNELIKYYSQSRIFILPSRAEGFGMVLLQALSCGLPIVASRNTGGPDLFKLINKDDGFINVFEELNEDQLDDAINRALNYSKKQNGLRNYLGDQREDISWNAYGKRYSNFLLSKCE